MKKLLALLLAAIMLCTMTAFAVAEEDDWLTLRVEAYDRSIAGFNVEDCMQLRYAQENFGDPNHIKLVYVPVSRWDEGDVLVQMFAANNAPDLCLTYNGDFINQAISEGSIWQLDDLLAEYGQGLVNFLGAETLMPFGQKDFNGDGTPEQWFIPARRLNVADVGYFIREDWLKALNMEKSTDVAGLTEFFRAAKAANLGGAQTVPMHIDLYESNPLYNISRFIDSFIDFNQVTEEDWFAAVELHEMLPGSKEGYRWLNQLWNEGLLYENFFIDNNDEQDNYLVNGFYGFFSMQPDQPWRTDKNYEIEMEKAVEGAHWVSVNPFKNESINKYPHSVYAANGLSIIIPKTASEEVAAAAIKYMDWMAQPENMFFMQNGVEGINYLNTTEDGIPCDVQSADNVADEYKMHAGDICFISNGLYYGSEELNAKGLALAFEARFADDIAQSYVDANTDPWTQNSFTVTINASTDFGASVKNKQAKFLTDVITCPADQFDAVYDAAIADTLNAGADKIMEEQREAYKAGNYRGTFPGNK